jgi:uncharacterized protein YkwD
VRSNRALKGLARNHNKVMLRQDCFRHQCRGEAPLAKRLERSAYLGPGDRYGFGQNLGFGPTPQAMIDRWMKNTPHRRNILGKRFRHIGVGVGRGTPIAGKADRPNATYTVLFAWRKR